MNKKINRLQNLVNQIKNDITIPILSDFLNWFYDKLNIHFNKKTPNLKYQKWDIYFVSLWNNIWSELNKNRPCVVYSKRSYNNKNWVVIIPLKSLKKKKIINKFQVKISKSKTNWLEKDSIVDIFYIKNLSTKRINKYIWKLEELYLEEIDKKIIKMFWLKKEKQ